MVEDLNDHIGRVFIHVLGVSPDGDAFEHQRLIPRGTQRLEDFLGEVRLVQERHSGEWVCKDCCCCGCVCSSCFVVVTFLSVVGIYVFLWLVVAFSKFFVSFL